MRLARKIALLAMLAIAALGTSVPSASGQTLEFTDEDTGLHCPAVSLSGHDVTGGCDPIHAASTGDVTLRAHIFGIESNEATCQSEFDARFDEDGNGYVYNQTLTGPGCTREPCEEAGGATEPWQWTAREDAGGEWVQTTYCLSTTSDMTDRPTCDVDIPFTQVGHDYEFGRADGTEIAGNGPSAFRCELIGHWTTEGETLAFSDETTGEDCPPVSVSGHVVSGGCDPIHVTSTGSITLRAHIFGVESTDNVCSQEFDASFDEDGDGYVYNVALAGASCSREPCEEANGSRKPWQVSSREDAASPTGEYMDLSFCVATTSDMTNRPQCNVPIPFTDTGGHNYELGNTGGVEMPGVGTPDFRCELIGHWTTEGETNLEATHTNGVGLEVTHNSGGSEVTHL